MTNRKIMCLVVALSIGFATPTIVTAETIAVIGTGSVGSALGPRFAEIGHTVVYGSRTPEAAQMAEIVLLAIPWEVAEDVVVSLGDLSGKIIIEGLYLLRANARQNDINFEWNYAISERPQR